MSIDHRPWTPARQAKLAVGIRGRDGGGRLDERHCRINGYRLTHEVGNRSIVGGRNQAGSLDDANELPRFHDGNSFFVIQTAAIPGEVERGNEDRLIHHLKYPRRSRPHY
jgi:hypothetical protein